ncbi:MAG: hypothetical protein KC910_19095 [Candidatus Eremiobacteraeota bacterium]|nr:hypothetical protein [Candidatus Eremiobacteraeota bacterium]
MAEQNADSKPHQEEPAPEVDSLANLVAVLIAVATILGAVVAWRAALSEDIAGDSDYAGIRCLNWAEEARTIHSVDAYEDYRLFLAYRRNDLLGDLIEEKEPESGTFLDQKREEARQLAEINVSFLDQSKASRYLSRDGSFALDRELGEKWAAARRKRDMNSEVQFSAADRYRKKTEAQLKAGVLLTFSLVLLTLVESFAGPIRYALVAGGALFIVWGSIWALLLERLS